MLLAAENGTVWHYWIAVALVVPAILAVILVIVLYLRKVTHSKYGPG